MTKSIAIIGAGIVGICTAIELLKTGHQVTLFDKDLPGTQASLWNAGVLSTASLVPMNSPALISKIPALLSGRMPGFKFDRAKLFHTMPWAIRFLANSHRRRFQEVVPALNNLIALSLKLHKAHIAELRQPDLIVEKGWLFLYRTKAGFVGSKMQGDILDRYEVSHSVLGPDKLAELEPGLCGPIYKARFIKDSLSADPALLLRAYIGYLHRLGGKTKQAKITSVLKNADGIAVLNQEGETETFSNVIVAAGAWSNQVLRSVGVKLPMAVERGYLKTFALKGGSELHRPVCDVEAGYVVSPRSFGVQISTGTELTTIHAKPDASQLSSAIDQLKTMLPLGEPIMDTYAVSNRPSLSDSLPAIGPVKGVEGLWLATGHQHLGFSTSAGTGKLISAQINGERPDIDPRPYLPSRFNI